jgi:DNA helicase-2/ATP-dependent DNA helicase PcrA
MGVVITSDDSIDIDQNFRISAGPGAGKTRWLVRHIQHILADSRRLDRTRKIACVTYTNVGVDTIKKRLSLSASRVEICTFHSFLFKYIVSPYWHLIAEKEGLDIEQFQGESNQVYTGWFHKILDEIKQPYLMKNNDFGQLEGMVKNLLWSIEADGIELHVRNRRRYNLRIRDNFFYRYKKKAWSEGIVSYDDIHYFSYRLLKEYPYIANLVADRFPYILVDEFQDTTPVQTEVLKILSKVGCFIGVVGDEAQCIYGFNGIQTDHFKTFSLNGLKDYEIKGNQRSTRQIIDVLNIIRPNFPQEPVKNRSGEKPILLVGPRKNAIDFCKEYCNDNFKCLAYSNEIVKEIAQYRQGENYMAPVKWSELNDSNTNRRFVIMTSLKAIEDSRKKSMKTALQEMEKLGKTGAEAVSILCHLYDSYSSYSEESLLHFVGVLKDHDISVTLIRKNSNQMSSYSLIKYRQIVQSELSDYTDEQQSTIHQAKGAGYPNVLVVFEKEKDLVFLLHPDLTNEKNRVYYVALSRAETGLFLNVPDLSKKSFNVLTEIPISIKKWNSGDWEVLQ